MDDRYIDIIVPKFGKYRLTMLKFEAYNLALISIEKDAKHIFSYLKPMKEHSADPELNPLTPNMLDNKKTISIRRHINEFVFLFKIINTQDDKFINDLKEELEKSEDGIKIDNFFM